MRGRVKRLYDAMDVDLDAVVVMNDTDPFIDLSFYYVTGARSGLFEGCAAVARPDGSVDLHTSTLEENSARESDSQVRVFSDREGRIQALRDSVDDAKRIGVNGAALTHRSASFLREALPDVEIVDVWRAFEAARMVKDAAEVEAIARACSISARVGETIPTMVRDGVTESELAAEINYRMRLAGATGIAFDPICAFGPNAAHPHYMPGDARAAHGDCLLFDFGCSYGRYCSDMTRTFFLGDPDDRMRRVYETVLEAQLAGIDAMRPGVTGRDVDAAARDVIDASEFKGLFIHGFGHSVGLSVHDGAGASPRTDMVLEEGMVITAEPGIYIEGVGGVRIEDTVVVTAEGCRVLTSEASKTLTVI